MNHQQRQQPRQYHIRKNIKKASSSLHYQYCSEAECNERQQLGQVNELESTKETCMLPQSQRRLDPLYAVPKYRRSAAGGGVTSASIGGGVSATGRSASQLVRTLNHLMYVASYRRASPDHPTIENAHTVLLFLIDRLRACQADATRISGGSDSCYGDGIGDENYNDDDISLLPATWHLKLLRLLIWIKFLWELLDTDDQNDDTAANGNTAGSNNDSLTPRTIQTMISTSIEMYWAVREVEMGSPTTKIRSQSQEYEDQNDDEVLCYSGMLHVSSISIASCLSSSSPMNQQQNDWNWNRILLEFNKRKRQLLVADTRKRKQASSSSTSYPLWHETLRAASYASRQEFSHLFNPSTKSSMVNTLPVLARCCCASALFLWRYRTVQQYNVTFGKNETVNDLHRLLGVHDDDWTIDYAKEFCLPVSLLISSSSTEKEWDSPSNGTENRSNVTVTMKSMAIPDLDERKTSIQRCCQSRIRSTRRWVLGEFFNDKEVGGLSPAEILCLVEKGKIIIPTTANGDRRSDTSENQNSNKPISSLQQQMVQLSMNGGQNPRRTSSVSEDQKKTRAKCKFFARGQCRYGDTCRFEHSL